MPATNLFDLITAHHLQAAYMAAPTFRQRNPGTDTVGEMKKVGNRFTTRVEKRLRKLEMARELKEISMATPQEHIDQAKNLARLVEDSSLVRRAYIDDWGRHSNFTLIVYPEQWDRYTTTRLKALVNRVCKQRSDMHLRDCFPPEPVRAWCVGEERSRIVGYHDDCWKFDIDVYPYDAESNSFAMTG